MLKVTADELRKITTDVIQAAKGQLDVEKRRRFMSAMEQLKIDATSGRKYSVAMSLNRGDHYESAGSTPRTLDPDKLLGVAALLHNQLSVFAPTIEYWSKVEYDQRDESWTNDGLNLVLHWTDAEDLLAKLDSVEQDDMVSAIRLAIAATQTAIVTTAKGILVQLKDQAARQARLGKNWALVMSLRDGADFVRPEGVSIMRIDASWLGPVAKAVFDACRDFKPTLEYWSKQEYGYDRETWTVEGVNIVVHW